MMDKRTQTALNFFDLFERAGLADETALESLRICEEKVAEIEEGRRPLALKGILLGLFIGQLTNSLPGASRATVDSVMLTLAEVATSAGQPEEAK
jgi:hypothetical protein